MWFKKKECKACEVLKQENEYLRKFIDSLLAKLNMQQITIPAEEIPDVRKPEEEKVSISKDGEAYGLD